MVAGSWRRHYDRLHLHTPKRFSALPGLAMPGGWPRYPARDQVVEYLEDYRRHFDLRPHFGVTVQRVERVDGSWVTTTDGGVWRSDNIVLATGRARVPVRPTWTGMDGFRGDLLHSSEFRNGDPWRGRPVLVVGFGNSACEQALDLVEHGAEVHLAVRSPVNVLPRDFFGVVPVLPIGVAMRRLPPRLADALAWPLVRITVGDVRKVGLGKLPYGPNTQIARDHRVPPPRHRHPGPDPTGPHHAPRGPRPFHRGRRRLRRRLAGGVGRRGAGHRVPGRHRGCPGRVGGGVRQLGDADHLRRPHRPRGPLLLRDVRLASRDATRDRDRGDPDLGRTSTDAPSPHGPARSADSGPSTWPPGDRGSVG